MNRPASTPRYCSKTRKRSYRTKLQAEADMAAFRRSGSGRKPHRVYQCSHCYGFHLTADEAAYREHQWRKDRNR
jgi:hypothetical protein